MILYKYILYIYIDNRSDLCIGNFEWWSCVESRDTTSFEENKIILVLIFLRKTKNTDII